MLPSWFLFAVSFIVLLGFAGVMIRRRAASQSDGPDWNWARDFSIDKYRPMQRLLSQEDYTFLKSQPGYHPSMARTLRSSRRQAFRSYMSSLRHDFDRLYLSAKFAVLHSDTDQSELVTAIFKQRVIFYSALCLIEVRLGLYTLGIGSVDIRPVLGALEAVRDATRVLQPSLIEA